jgi:hypothetical protein
VDGVGHSNVTRSVDDIGYVEAVFDRDGNTVEGGTALAVGEEMRKLFCPSERFGGE